MCEKSKNEQRSSDEKKISICISCYNEEQNVIPLYHAIREALKETPQYDYEIIFADNGSSDGTQKNLRILASKDYKVKVIINNHNFGAGRSAAHCVERATGDAVIGMAADFQEPPELIPKFIQAWQAGSLVVLGQKKNSEEKGLMKWCRKLYYHIINAMAEFPQYNQVTGFGLQDRSVVDLINSLGDKNVPTRNLLAELGYEVELIPYDQPVRKYGKSSYNFFRYLDYAINSVVRSSRVLLRTATIMGGIASVVSFIIGVVYLIYKLLNWNTFMAGMAPMMIGIFFLGSVQLLFLGVIGEYIGAILNQIVKRPLVVEKETINFGEVQKETNGEKR